MSGAPHSNPHFPIYYKSLIEKPFSALYIQPYL